MKYLCTIVMALAGFTATGQNVPDHNIEWDEYGVPYIYADDWSGLAYGWGWAQAKNHADILLPLFAQARGKGAEYFGATLDASSGLVKEPDPVDMVTLDRITHVFGLLEHGAASYAAMSDDMRAICDNFAQGITDYVTAHPDEVHDLAETVLPITGLDVATHSIRTTTLFQLGPRMAIVQKWLTDGGEQHAANLLDVVSEPVAGAGSNAWVIGPSRSESGNPLLLANPHLKWDASAMTFMQGQFMTPIDARELSEADIFIHGTSVIGLPSISMGVNAHLGWANTVNRVNTVSIYELPMAGLTSYLYDGEAKPFDMSRGVIRVKQPDGTLEDIEVPILRSPDHHGAAVLGKKGAAVVVIHVPILDAYGSLDQGIAMAEASTLQEFQDAVALMHVPMFNLLCAGRDADSQDPHIYYVSQGRVPERPFGGWEYWWNVVPGHTSETAWSGYHCFEELPQVADPEGGFLQNCNDAPWTSTFPSALSYRDYPLYMAPRYMHLRAQGSSRIVLQKQKWNFDELIAAKFTDRVEMADHMLDDLVAAARTLGGRRMADAVSVLEGWDRTMSSESRGAALFLYWYLAYGLTDVMAEDLWAVPWSADAFEAAATPEEAYSLPRGLADPARAVAALAEAAKRLKDEYGAIDIPWGEVARLQVGDMDIPANGGPGDPMGLFHAIPLRKDLRPDISGPPELPISLGENDGGETFVLVAEFTPEGPRVSTVHSYGNASQPNSPHRSDQLQLMQQKKMRPIIFRAK